MKLCSLLLLLFSLHSAAEVFTWVNENGVREYGDEPPAHAKKAKLPELQKLKTLKIPEEKKVEPGQIEGDESFTGYSELSILSPKQDVSISSEEASNISIQLHISPALHPKHEVILLLDGKVIKSGPQLNFNLENVARGSHLIQARVKYQGQLLISTKSRRIHVQRTSILNRNNAR